MITLHDHELDQDALTRALVDLPAPAAPETLRPRVMAAIERIAARPWYARGWRAWPIAWQATSAVVVLACAGAAIWGAPPIEHVVRAWIAAHGAGLWARVAGPRETFAAVSIVAGAVWRVTQPLAGYVLVALLGMGTVCAALGLGLNRVLLRGVSP